MKTMTQFSMQQVTGWILVAGLSLAFCGNTEKLPGKSSRIDLVPALQDTVPALCYLALGDSYTIGQSVPEAERFPVQVVEALQKQGYTCKKPEIIAETGWTTEDLRSAIKDKKASPSYDFVTLLIGVNDQYGGATPAEYRIELKLLLAEAIRLAGKRRDRVILLSIPDYSVTPFARSLNKASIAKAINGFNRVNAELAALYHVNYVDITRESREAARDLTLVASDGLHFSAKEYRVWASLLVPVIRHIMQ